MLPSEAGTKKNKAALAAENAAYSAKVDSLKTEVERLRYEVFLRDSIAAVAASLEDFEAAATTGWSPVEYSSEMTDSLLSIWYLQRSISENAEADYNMDSVRFSSNVPDSVYIKRIEQMNSFITLPYNSIVRNHIILYSEKMNANIGKIIGLSRYYMPIFEEIFSEYDLPEELKAMAVIESSLNPLAVSRVGAKGMWQFMYGTAKHYKLHINSFVDERLDPIASAHAAAQYLRDGYEIFGDWNLAIASYNCGAGNVNKAIRRSGGSRKFWDIYPYLPRETRGYVPAFVGALYVLNYYKEHGIEPVQPGMPAAVDTFRINKMLHFKQIQELAGVPLQDLRNLNPQYRHDIIPGNEREYILRIPFNYSNAFIDAEDSLYTHKSQEYFNPVVIKKIKDGGDGERIVYRVKSGDVLGKIANRYRVSVSAIKRWNNLRSNTIRVGQRLIIYSGVKVPSGGAAASKSGSTSASQSSKPKRVFPADTPFTWYTIKSGDNFYDIAKKYPGVSAQDIMDFNGISSSRIYPGLKIKIPQL